MYKPQEMITAPYTTFTGKVLNERQVESYNRYTDEYNRAITMYDGNSELQRDHIEGILNQRHSYFMAVI